MAPSRRVVFSPTSPVPASTSAALLFKTSAPRPTSMPTLLLSSSTVEQESSETPPSPQVTLDLSTHPVTPVPSSSTPTSSPVASLDVNAADYAGDLEGHNLPAISVPASIASQKATCSLKTTARSAKAAHHAKELVSNPLIPCSIS